jgi:predicted alpha/beta superfamily hydrolase
MRSLALLFLAVLTAGPPDLFLGPDSRFALVWGPSVVTAQASNSVQAPSRDERFVVRSAVLGEVREVWVHLPQGWNSGERFDAVYVLDADALYPLTAGETDFRVVMRKPPRLVTVGITSMSANGRSRDFTPVDDSLPGDSIHAVGKADNFIRFLETEVIPVVAQRYPVTSHRILVGHSLAGLFALHVLATRPELFDRYIAISPTIPFANEAIITSLTAHLAGTPGAKVLFASTANEEYGYPQGLDHLEALLRHSAPASLRWKIERFPHEDHAGTVPPALHDGLEFVFDSAR